VTNSLNLNQLFIYSSQTWPIRGLPSSPLPTLRSARVSHTPHGRVHFVSSSTTSVAKVRASSRFARRSSARELVSRDTRRPSCAASFVTSDECCAAHDGATTARDCAARVHDRRVRATRDAVIRARRARCAFAKPRRGTRATRTPTREPEDAFYSNLD
jgi:hypothetical protein